MIDQRWMIVIGVLLAVFLSYEAFAQEQLSVQQDTAEHFTGSYSVNGQNVRFHSELIADDRVLFSIDVNGEQREATFDMSGRQLQVGTQAEMSDQAQDLMFDAMNAVSDYYLDIPGRVHKPALVLVSAMGYWTHR